MKLLIEDDEGHRTVVPVIHDEITIGRGEGHTVRLTERNVSRDHARIVRKDDQLYIEDIDARYGIELNGSRIEGRVPFNEGDVVHIGDYRLTLRPEDVQNTESAVTKPQPKVSKQEGDDGDDEEFASLTVVSRHQPGETFKLDADALVIGRDETCDIVLNHRSVSGRHARMVREGDDYRIIDLDSSNGVKVDGERYRSMPLEPGDAIELGHVKLRFVGPGESWQFDADETLAEPSTPAAKRGTSEMAQPEEDSEDRGIVVLGAFGIVLVAVVAVVAIRLHDPKPAAETAQAPQPDVGVVARAPESSDPEPVEDNPAEDETPESPEVVLDEATPDAAGQPSQPTPGELAAASEPAQESTPEPAPEPTPQPAPSKPQPEPKPERDPEPEPRPAPSEPVEPEPRAAPSEPADPEQADAGPAGPAPEELFETATRKWVQGDAQGAIEDCRRALERGYAPCYRVIGMAQKQMGNTREACRHFREYVSTEPDDARKIRRQMNELGCQ